MKYRIISLCLLILVLCGCSTYKTSDEKKLSETLHKLGRNSERVDFTFKKGSWNTTSTWEFKNVRFEDEN